MEPVEATVAPDQEIWEAMTLMTQKRVRHLPVVEGGHLVGLISIGDVVYSLLNHQSVQIQELLNYIQGNP
ncbi:CBS domain-containing protein [Thermus thermophilus]|nr:CBS domain-containing protein [Thermus thermophilus]